MVATLAALLSLAGTHTRLPFLNAHSIYYEQYNNGDASNQGRLPFASVSKASIDAEESTFARPLTIQNNAPLTIEWSGLPPATSETSTRDVIALTCDNLDWPLNEAFDVVAVPPSAALKGAGSVELPALPELRCSYIARYVRGGAHGVILSEKRLESSSIDLPRPTSVHLSFTPQRDEMLVIWVSGGGGHTSETPLVEWGLAHNALSNTVKGTSSTYHASDMCDAPANHSSPLDFIDPGAIRRVLLRGLPPSTRIYYRVGGAGKLLWGEVHSFMSRRALTSSPSSLKFLMYADQALPVPGFYAWRMTNQVVKDIEAGYDAFLLHPGDLGYAEGSGYIWDVWGGLVEPISSRIAYMVTVGNHEYDHIGKRLEPSGAPAGGWHPSWGNLGDDSHGECGVPTAARFNGTGSAHAAVEGSNGVFWYSFEEGPVHVAVVSSEHNWTKGSRQYTWLENDLASVNKSVTPYIVLATHRMMYTTQTHEVGDYKVSLVFRREVEPLLTKYRVDLMLVGHQHSYERSCPARGGACVSPGTPATTHLCVGSAGASLEKGGFNSSLGHFSLKHVNAWGYIRLDANASRMRIEFVRTNAYDDEDGHHVPPGQVWDHVEVLPWL